jgi:hemerythrin-like domain-containing protein
MAIVAPSEDLMNEHGVLRRLLMLYEVFVREIEAGNDVDRALVLDVATIFRTFGEDYHEKMEETYVFPRVRRYEPGLIATLIDQHQVGRKYTDDVARIARRGALWEAVGPMQVLVDMYRHHAAWEDTVVFPLFTKSITNNEMVQFSEVFEETEEKRFGKHGFENILHQVIEIEHDVGIVSLSQFTP